MHSHTSRSLCDSSDIKSAVKTKNKKTERKKREREKKVGIHIYSGVYLFVCNWNVMYHCANATQIHNLFILWLGHFMPCAAALIHSVHVQSVFYICMCDFSIWLVVVIIFFFEQCIELLEAYLYALCASTPALSPALTKTAPMDSSSRVGHLQQLIFTLFERFVAMCSPPNHFHFELLIRPIFVLCFA